MDSIMSKGEEDIKEEKELGLAKADEDGACTPPMHPQQAPQGFSSIVLTAQHEQITFIGAVHCEMLACFLLVPLVFEQTRSSLRLPSTSVALDTGLYSANMPTTLLPPEMCATHIGMYVHICMQKCMHSLF